MRSYGAASRHSLRPRRQELCSNGRGGGVSRRFLAIAIGLLLRRAANPCRRSGLSRPRSPRPAASLSPLPPRGQTERRPRSGHRQGAGRWGRRQSRRRAGQAGREPADRGGLGRKAGDAQERQAPCRGWKFRLCATGLPTARSGPMRWSSNTIRSTGGRCIRSSGRPFRPRAEQCASWPRTPIDAFLSRALDSAGLKPSLRGRSAHAHSAALL